MKKLEDLLLAPLLTLTELRAITVTTFSPPRRPLMVVAIPKAFKSLFTFPRFTRPGKFCGSILNTFL